MLGLAQDVPPVLDTLLAHIHPEDRDTFVAELEATREATAPTVRDHRMVHQSGRTLWVQTAVHVHEPLEQGQAQMILGTQINVSHRQARALELQSTLTELHRTTELLEMSGRMNRTGWWWVDKQDRRVYWSKMTRDIHEVDADFEPDLESSINFYIEAHRPIIQRWVEKTLATGEPFEGEFQILTAKNNLRWVKTVCEVEHVEGEAVKLFGSFQDITAYKRNEEKLVRARHRAESASRTKSEFLTNMSHEIRTPLNGVIGFSELLLHTALDTKQKNYVDAIMRSGMNLTHLLSDILDYSKIEAGQVPLEPENIRLADWIQRASDDYTRRAHQHNLRFLLNLGPRLPESVYVDQKALSKVLDVLLSNALKFTEQGEIELRIEMTEQNKLLFAVRDTGIGIAPENHQKIFELFTQVDGSRTRKHSGSGLGLSICQHLLTLMKSELQLRSAIGVGSTFSFMLELLPQVHADGLFERALIVDDNPANRQILEEMLQLLQVPTRSCSTGEAALHCLQTEFFDLAVVDDQMPGMHGLEVIKKIREQHHRLAILLCHSSHDTDEIAAARRDFAIEDAPKPLTFDAFQHLLYRMSKGVASRAPHVNHARLKERMEGLELDLNAISATICHAVRQDIAPLQDAVQQGRLATVESLLQRMRGSARYLCFDHLVELIEQLGAEKHRPEAFKKLLKHVEAELTHLENLRSEGVLHTF